MNKSSMTVYVSDVDIIPAQAVEQVMSKDGFKHSAKKRMYEFLINVVGISHEYQLDNSDMDFECMLDHITDVDLCDLSHEPLRTIELDAPVTNEIRMELTNITVHSFVYHAPNSQIHVKYLYLE